MKWQRTRPRYDISMLIYMYKNIWTVKACGGGGGGGGDVVFALAFAENGRVRPFLTILTMIAGVFRIFCKNDSRV